MDVKDRQFRQDMLINTLREMAGKLYQFPDIITATETFYSLYEDGKFRHSYSAFLPFIAEINASNNTYSLDYLSENLQVLSTYVSENQDILGNTQQSLFKLCDHLNLEIARITTYSNDSKIQDTEAKFKVMTQKLAEASKETQDASERAKTLQTEVVSVLSIFSAIVIAFFGGMNFISSAISSIEKVHIFKSILICLTCGIVMLNIIFLLLYFVGKITKRNIYAICKTAYCTCKNGIEPECNGINRLRKRLPYVFWANIMLITFVIIDIICWLLNFYNGGGCLY
jgi:hypothetical protein